MSITMLARPGADLNGLDTIDDDAWQRIEPRMAPRLDERTRARLLQQRPAATYTPRPQGQRGRLT
jgi:hypothetical protein